MSKADHYEIERRFLIRKPERSILAQGVTAKIWQTYLLCDEGTERVRKREEDGGFTYTHTVKKRISHIRRLETEGVIPEEAYQRLLGRADPQRRTIEKERCYLSYQGQLLEIDFFPFFSQHAILEIELEDEAEELKIPPWLEIVREITGDPRYTNAAMAKEIPPEEG